MSNLGQCGHFDFYLFYFLFLPVTIRSVPFGAGKNKMRKPLCARFCVTPNWYNGVGGYAGYFSMTYRFAEKDCLELFPYTWECISEIEFYA